MNGINRRTISAYADYHCRSAPLVLLWLPDSFVATAGTVTSITNLGQQSPTQTLAGSPALGSATGPTGIVVPGMVHDGVDDMVTIGGASPISFSDDGITVLALYAPNDANAGDYRTIVEFSDTGANGRSAWAAQVFTSMGALCANGNGQATGTYNSTSLALFTFVFRNDSRRVHKNGVHFADYGAPAIDSPAAARTVTTAVVGARPAGGKLGKGVLCALAIYAGVPDDRELERIEGALMDLAGITRPWTWRDIGAVSPPSPPQWSCPGAVAFAKVGEPFTIFKRNVLYSTGDPKLQAKLPAGKHWDRSDADRWVYTPTAAGDTVVTFYNNGSGGDTSTITIRAAAALGGGAPTRNIITPGDSRGNRAKRGAYQIVKNRLGSAFGCYGTVAAATGCSVTQEGHDSWTTTYFVTAAGDGVTPSALFNGGPVLDIAGYAGTLGITAHAAVFWLAFNDWYGQASLAAAQGVMTATTLPNLDTLFAACWDYNADLPIILIPGEPLAADPAAWGGVTATRDLKYSYVRDWTARALAYYTDEPRVHVSAAHWLGCDSVRGYSLTDAIHSERAHRAHATALEAALIGMGVWS